MENHELINQSSGNVEWWTPMDIIEAAKELFGGEIDLLRRSTNQSKMVRRRKILSQV